MTDKPTRRWASQQEVAVYLGCTDRTVRNLVARGDLNAYRLGARMIRLDLNEVDAMLSQVPTAGRALPRIGVKRRNAP